MDVIIAILLGDIARRFSDLVQGDRDTAVETFHEINFLCAQFLTAMVGCQKRVKSIAP